jgi:hypothetical protein
MIRDAEIQHGGERQSLPPYFSPEIDENNGNRHY